MNEVLKRDVVLTEAADTEFANEKVSGNRQSFWQVLVVMVGFTFFTPSMTAGGNLGLGLTLSNFIIAVVLGNLFLSFYTGFLAHIGQTTGMNLDLLARKSFGDKGSYVPSLLIGLTQMGWLGVGVAMFAIPVSDLYGINTYLLVLLVGTAFTITSIFGIKALAFFGSIAVPLIAILGFYSMGISAEAAGGFMNIFPETPAQPMTMAAALSIVIGNFVSGGTSTPNFTRFAKTSKIAVVATVIAFFAGNILMFVFGATGAAVFGKADIFDVLIMQGLAIPAILSLGLNIWSTSNNGLYTSGLSLSNVTKKPVKLTTAAAGIVGTLLALVMYDHFIAYLSLLGSMIPPVGAVIIIHYYFNKDSYKEVGNNTEWDMKAIISVAIGIAVGLIAKVGITPINSLIATSVIYTVMELVSRGRK